MFGWRMVPTKVADEGALDEAWDLGYVPDGVRVYAFGDVHGRADLLLRKLEDVEAHLAADPVASPLLMFLGDYIDRGHDSKGVFDLLTTWTSATRAVFLRGNHEQMLLDFLNDPEELETWRKLGGLETLASYNIPVQHVSRGLGYKEAHGAFLKSVPRDHLLFLEQTMPSASI